MPRTRCGEPVRRLVMASCLAVLLAALACAPEPRARTTSPRRIVAVAPNVVEILFELGLGDRVVGVGSYSKWPPEVVEKTKIGGLLDPRLETIVELEPDVAFLLPSERDLGRALADLGVEVEVLTVETIVDVERAVAAIGERTETSDRAREEISRLRREIAARPDPLDLSVLLVVGRQPGNLADIYVAAAGTFLDELLARLGASNAFADSPVRYPNIGLEQILLRAPDVVVELQPEPLGEGARERLVADWKKELAPTPPCVAIIEGDYTLLPGPRLPLLYRELERVVASCEGERA